MISKRRNTQPTEGEEFGRDIEVHSIRQRKTLVSIEQRLQSRLLQNLVSHLIVELDNSGLTKPAFAETLGISGSQFRYLRSGVANPSIGMLATFAERLHRPLYELLESRALGHRLNLSGEEMNAVFSATVKARYSESGMFYAEFAE